MRSFASLPGVQLADIPNHEFCKGGEKPLRLSFALQFTAFRCFPKNRYNQHIFSILGWVQINTVGSKTSWGMSRSHASRRNAYRTLCVLRSPHDNQQSWVAPYLDWYLFLIISVFQYQRTRVVPSSQIRSRNTVRTIRVSSREFLFKYLCFMLH